MTIPVQFKHRLRLPLIASPMFFASGIELVMESRNSRYHSRA